MSDVTGSIVSVTLDGMSYNAAADANLSAVGSQYEVSAIATSGAAMKKMVKRVETVESVNLIVNGDEKAALKALAELTIDVTMAYTEASGDVYFGLGFFEFVKRDTEDGKAELKLFPRNGWEPFLA